MLGPALQSPQSRGTVDIERRVALLEKYESWRTPVHVNFEKVVEPELWKRHNENWTDVLALLDKSQQLAKEIRRSIDLASRRVA
jgi:hypothetical protein